MFSLLSFFILSIIIFCIYSKIKSKAYEKQYCNSILKLLDEKKKHKNLKIKVSIKALYDGYKSQSSFSYLNFDELNNRLIFNLRSHQSNSKNSKNDISEPDIQLLESIFKEIYDDISFSDEKSSLILDEIEKSSMHISEKKTLREQFIKYFTSINYYCDGRISEKQTQINTLQYEIKKNKKKKNSFFNY